MDPVNSETNKASTRKRGRACEACSRVKIKCELGSAPEAKPPCGRCVRLNKECVLVAPKRNKDRVTELEAQVEALTKLLRAQGIEESAEVTAEADARSGESSENTEIQLQSSAPAKKRRLEDQTLGAGQDPAAAESKASIIRRIDSVISPSMQERALEQYTNVMFECFPIVPVGGGHDISTLRSDWPILLLSIIYAASPGVLSPNAAEDIGTLLLEEIIDRTVVQGKKDFQLLSALHITCLWYRFPKRHFNVAIYELIELADTVAQNIGMIDPLSSPNSGAPGIGQDLESTDAWRVSLGCYLLSASIAISVRRPNRVLWTPQHEACLIAFQYCPRRLPTDYRVAQYVRAEHMCDSIAHELGLHDEATFLGVSDPTMKQKLQACNTHILNWKLKIPHSPDIPSLVLSERVARAYMHEPVLHTPSNKQSFAAPYVPERLSISDFPAPTVAQEHENSLFELIGALHGVIDFVAKSSTSTILGYPVMLFTARAAYALYALAKLHIAVTAEGNTYGAVLSPESVQVEQRAQQLVDVADRLRESNGTDSVPYQIFSMSARMKEWISNYDNNHLASMAPVTQPPSSIYSLAQNEAIDNGLLNVDEASFSMHGMEIWDSLFPLFEDTADSGLDALNSGPF